MYKETLRKITSLSLLTILLTSTAAIAMQNALPQAHAATNATLFVSAENSQFQNYFAGPQVIQVIVADPDINRLDQAYGEPTVTVNGKKLRMAQATDGNWYAYFADRNQAIFADQNVGLPGKGLDFGQFCSSTSTFAPNPGVDYSETKGFTVARAGVTGATNAPSGSAGFGACTTSAGAGAKLTHVIREEKALNTNTAGFNANANYTGAWPIIQLYDFCGFPTDVTVDYHKAGGDQIVPLHFDRIPTNLISTSVDRTAYPVNTQVFVQLNDPQLNIDPTEEDSWTWGANAANSTLYYQAFNRNGGADADGTAAMQNLIGNLTNFMFNHNGQVLINPAAQGVNVLAFQKNGKEPLVSTSPTSTTIGATNQVRTASIGINSAPVTFIESGGVNTGTFVDWDGGKIANLVTDPVTGQGIRDHSATISYNDVKTSIVGGFGFASLTVTATNNTWASGQKIQVTLTDTDANRNSKITEHLDLFNPAIYNGQTGGVPTMTIGTPFSLSPTPLDKAVFTKTTATAATAISGIRTVGALGTNTTTTVAQADAINVERLDLVTPTTAPANTFTLAATGSLIIDPNKKMSDLL